MLKASLLKFIFKAY